MKRMLRNVSFVWPVFISIFTPTDSKASTKSDVTARVNKIRNTLQEKIQRGDIVELTGKDFYNNGQIDEWANWGNWGNWNNWNNDNAKADFARKFLKLSNTKKQSHGRK